MTKILVGLGTCGIAAGAQETYNALARKLEAGVSFDLGKTGCIGMCYREPLVELHFESGARFQYGGVTPERVERILDEHLGQG